MLLLLLLLLLFHHIPDPHRLRTVLVAKPWSPPCCAATAAAVSSHLPPFKVKLAVSGSWESALLKVTWPDDLPPDEALVRTTGACRDKLFSWVWLRARHRGLEN